MKYTIYTDGSCIQNPNGPGSYCSIIFNGKYPKIITEYYPSTTNQRMELLGVIVSLEEINKDSDVTICSDSAYVCNCINSKWYVQWLANDWKNSKGENVANRDLWERLLHIISKHKSVEFIKVKGHSDNIFNNKCDMVARDTIDFTHKVMKLLEDRKV